MRPISAIHKWYLDYETKHNIKDPNKVELEQPEWMKGDSENSISIRDKNAFNRAVGMPHIRGDMLYQLANTVDDTDDKVTQELMSALTSGEHEYMWSWNRDLRKMSIPRLKMRLKKYAADYDSYYKERQQQMKLWARTTKDLDKKYQEAHANYIINYVALTAIEIIMAQGQITDVEKLVDYHMTQELIKQIDGLKREKEYYAAQIVESHKVELTRDITKIVNEERSTKDIAKKSQNLLIKPLSLRANQFSSRL